MLIVRQTSDNRHYVSLGGTPSASSAEHVVARAAAGEGLALRAVRESAGAVGRGIAAAVTLLDPEVVVITGGLSNAGQLWWGPMESCARAELIDVLSGIPLRHGELGGRAPLVGAAAPVWDTETPATADAPR